VHDPLSVHSSLKSGPFRRPARLTLELTETCSCGAPSISQRLRRRHRPRRGAGSDQATAAQFRYVAKPSGTSRKISAAFLANRNLKIIQRRWPPVPRRTQHRPNVFVSGRQPPELFWQDSAPWWAETGWSTSFNDGSRQAYDCCRRVGALLGRESRHHRRILRNIRENNLLSLRARSLGPYEERLASLAKPNPGRILNEPTSYGLRVLPFFMSRRSLPSLPLCITCLGARGVVFAFEQASDGNSRDCCHPSPARGREPRASFRPWRSEGVRCPASNSCIFTSMSRVRNPIDNTKAENFSNRCSTPTLSSPL